MTLMPQDALNYVGFLAQQIKLNFFGSGATLCFKGACVSEIGYFTITLPQTQDLFFMATLWNRAGHYIWFTAK